MVTVDSARLAAVHAFSTVLTSHPLSLP
jgi:hypothetical protein